MQGNRIVWIDVWKGMLIFLVVLGHVTGGLYHYVDGWAAFPVRLIFKFVYLFHIPAFFFIAGWVQGMSASDDSADFGAFVKKRAVRLLVPYAIWGVFSIVVFLSFASWAHLIQNGNDGYYNDTMFNFPWYRPFLSLLHGGGWPNREGLRFNGVLWFLPCMFLVLAIDRALRKFFVNVAESLPVKVAFIVVVALVGGLVRENVKIALPFSMNRVLNMLAYLMIGRLLAAGGWLDSLHRRPFYLVLGWVLLMGIAWYVPDEYYLVTPFPWYVYMMLLGLAGCVFSMATAKMVAEISPKKVVAIVAKTGVASLGIMLSHKFFIMPMQAGYAAIAKLKWSIVLLAAISMSVIVTWVALCLTSLIRRHAPIVIGERK